ncbi:MAG: hypothetical protein WBH85_04260 [Thermoanaerobaculia bacterium]
MQDMPSSEFTAIASNLAIVIPVLLALIGALIVYFVLMVRAIIDMLRHDANGVLLGFALLALMPLPPFVVMGIMVLIIWQYHKRDILAGKSQGRGRP